MRKHQQFLTSALSAGLATALLTAPAFGAPIGIINGDFELDGADNVAPPAGWTDLSVAGTAVLNQRTDPARKSAA